MAKMARNCDLVALDLHGCNLGFGLQGANKALEVLTRAGGAFLKWDRDGAAWILDSDPLRNMSADGSFSSSYFSHRLLERAPIGQKGLMEGLKTFNPTGRLSFLSGPQIICLSQGALSSQPDNLDSLARGQLALGGLLCSHLRPRLAYIDELGSNLPTEKNATTSQMRCILWANFFGPAYVEKYGRDFLMNAPGWKKEELDDGGILYVVTESYHDWWTKPPKDVLEYFRAKVPGIMLYRAKKSPDF